MSRPSLAVLMGAPSPEFEVSLMSAAPVLAALDREKYEVRPYLLGRDLSWTTTPGPAAPDFAPGDLLGLAPTPTGEALARLAGVDVALIVIHGAFGEDGRLQGLLDCLGVPYVGSDLAGSARAIDKALTKDLMTLAEIPHPESRVVRRDRYRARPALALEDLAPLGFPLVIKSPTKGSSFGLYMVDDEAGVAPALEAIFADEDRALVEVRLAAREVTCGVIAAPEPGKVVALPPTEIIPPEGRYFDFDAKYVAGESREVTPPEMPADWLATIQTRALQLHELLGLRDMSRTDMMVSADGHVTVLEVNTIPGLTPTSLLPQAAAAAGLPLPALLDRLIEAARARGPAVPEKGSPDAGV